MVNQSPASDHCAYKSKDGRDRWVQRNDHDFAPDDNDHDNHAAPHHDNHIGWRDRVLGTKNRGDALEGRGARGQACIGRVLARCTR